MKGEAAGTTAVKDLEGQNGDRSNKGPLSVSLLARSYLIHAEGPTGSRWIPLEDLLLIEWDWFLWLALAGLGGPFAVGNMALASSKVATRIVAGKKLVEGRYGISLHSPSSCSWGAQAQGGS